jgi:hypothetical protein
VQFNSSGSFGGSANLTWSGTQFFVQGTVSLHSGASGTSFSLSMGRTSTDATLGVAGSPNQYIVGSIAGDLVIRSESQAVLLGSGGGQAIYITAGTTTTGNLVGIQTSSPRAVLHVGTVVSGGNRMLICMDPSDSTSTSNKIGWVRDFDNWTAAYIGQIYDGAYGGVIGFFTHPASSFSVTAPTEKMRIDSSGFVGINTTAPAYFLDIRSASDYTLFHLGGNGAGDAGLYLYSQGANSGLCASGVAATTGGYVAKATAPAIWGDRDSSYWVICTDTGKTIGSTYTPTIRMVITKSNAYFSFGGGHIGVAEIDVRHPTDGTLLHLAGTGATDTGMYLVSLGGSSAMVGCGQSWDPSLGWIAKTASPSSMGDNSSTLWQITADSGKTVGSAFTPTSRLAIIKSSGNVGIGTTSPGYALDVVGDVQASGMFRGNVHSPSAIIGAADDLGTFTIPNGSIAFSFNTSTNTLVIWCKYGGGTTKVGSVSLI